MITEYNIKYHTHNEYDSLVKEAIFEFMVAPCQNNTQTVTNITYVNSFGEEVFQYKNAFGFQATRVRTAKPFATFEFTMLATVEKTQDNLLPGEVLTLAEEEALLHSRKFYIDHHLYLGSSRFTSIPDHYSLPTKTPDQSVYRFLLQLNQYIYDLLEFDTDPTDVHTTAGEVYELGKGVCQDYSHLFLTIARKSKIPCRYVSGYLNQVDTLLGAAVMHAWVEAYIPGVGWRGFDPTNNLLTDINHIKAAHGVDYSDCSPIKGVLKTTGGNRTSYEVKVKQNVLQTESQTQSQSQ